MCDEGIRERESRQTPNHGTKKSLLAHLIIIIFVVVVVVMTRSNSGKRLPQGRASEAIGADVMLRQIGSKAVAHTHATRGDVTGKGLLWCLSCDGISEEGRSSVRRPLISLSLSLALSFLPPSASVFVCVYDQSCD